VAALADVLLVDRPVGAIGHRHLVLLHDRAADRVAVFAHVLLVDRPADREAPDDVIVRVDGPAGGVPALAVVLFVHRPADGVAALFHDGVIHGAVANAGPVLPDRLVTGLVADGRHTALFGAATRGRVGRRPAVRGPNRSPGGSEPGQGEHQGNSQFQPHLHCSPRKTNTGSQRVAWARRGQAPLPERPEGCFAQRCLSPFLPACAAVGQPTFCDLSYSARLGNPGKVLLGEKLQNFPPRRCTGECLTQTWTLRIKRTGEAVNSLQGAGSRLFSGGGLWYKPPNRTGRFAPLPIRNCEPRKSRTSLPRRAASRYRD